MSSIFISHFRLSSSSNEKNILLTFIEKLWQWAKQCVICQKTKIYVVDTQNTHHMKNIDTGILIRSVELELLLACTSLSLSHSIFLFLPFFFSVGCCSFIMKINFHVNKLYNYTRIDTTIAFIIQRWCSIYIPSSFFLFWWIECVANS